MNTTMNTMTPIIINNSGGDVERCPECGKEEDLKTVCRHCGHEYEDDEPIGFLGWVIGISILGLIVWFILTMIFWFVGSLVDGDTLLDVLKSQWEFISNLKIY